MTLPVDITLLHFRDRWGGGGVWDPGWGGSGRGGRRRGGGEGG